MKLSSFALTLLGVASLGFSRAKEDTIRGFADETHTNTRELASTTCGALRSVEGLVNNMMDAKVENCNGDWGACCHACGNELQNQGKITFGWSCEQFGGAGIWLKGCSTNGYHETCSYTKSMQLFGPSETSAVSTYEEAVKFCAIKGASRLATLSEWCPYSGPPGGHGSTSVYQNTKIGDQWAPISDTFNDYVQVGTRAPGDTCKTHLQLGFGDATWGTNPNKLEFESNYILCVTTLV